MCPMYLGVKAVLAKSMERIHRANLINFGIVPLIFANPADYDALNPGDRVEIDDIRQQLLSGATRLTVRNATSQTTFEVECDLTDRERKIVAAGGLLNYTSKSM